MSVKSDTHIDPFKLNKKSFQGVLGRLRPFTYSHSLRRRTLAPLFIVIDGKDYTPKALNPDIYTAGKERQLSAIDLLDLERTKNTSNPTVRSHSQSTVRFKEKDKPEQIKGSASLGSGVFGLLETIAEIPSETLISGSSIDDRPSAGSRSSTSRSSEASTNVEVEVNVGDEALKLVALTPTSSQRSEEVLSVMKFPTEVKLLLTETDTFFLLDIPSATAEKDTDEGNQVERDNEIYLYLTEGKGRNRKIQDEGTQTVEVTMKSRSTFCPKPHYDSKATFASNWDMYDTYLSKEKIIDTEDEDAEETKYEIPFRTSDENASDVFRMSAEEKHMAKLINNPRFMEAVCVIERLLANNCYSEEQKIFRGLTVQDEFRENIEYKYTLKLLWTFANENTKGKSVNSLHWNPTNRDILAVGYGKFYFTDNIPGMVLIWNIKNPVQPERSYFFEDSVTAVKFSRCHPMLLAVGFYLGSVIILNIVSREKLIVAQNLTTFEAAWSICWVEGIGEELVIVAFDNGSIISYSIKKKMESVNLMRVAKADGKLKGIEAMKKCLGLTVPVTRYSSALFTRLHPENKTIYFIGTDDGVIHKCSFNYLNRHLEMFLAHEGPVRQMRFSPFSKKIFATCGDDWHTRIWAEGISEPLFELYAGQQSIQDFYWSPTHSTILVDIRGNLIQIWDIQRKTYRPQSITNNPAGCRNTTIQFTKSGRALIVGDIDGNVHVFAPEDMPFPAFFQENLLFESLYAGLKTEPTVLSNLKKIKKQANG